MSSSSAEPNRESSVPPVPIKTYQWEDVRRARLQGGYPWTHLDKEPLQLEEITAETILRDTSPCRRSASREPSADRRSPADAMATPPPEEPLRILMLDASPGSSRKMGEGEDEIVKVPNFSKEISLDSEEDVLDKSNPAVTPRTATPDQLMPVTEPKITVSPKGILKRKHPNKPKPLAEDSPRNSKCCHPFVEKIKHIADKTIHKTEKMLPKKDHDHKKRCTEGKQEILVLDCSPGQERRERQKLTEQGDSETPNEVNISLVMQTEENTDNPSDSVIPNSQDVQEIHILDVSPSSRRRKEHIYEDIEKGDVTDDIDDRDLKKSIDAVVIEHQINNNLEVDAKSADSKDPSLLIDEPMDDEESSSDSVTKIRAMYDISMTPDKLVVDIQNEALVLDEDVNIIIPIDDNILLQSPEAKNISPNITITDVTDDDPCDQNLILDPQNENMSALDKRVHFDMSESTTDPSPEEENPPGEGKENVWSKMSDHEYEPIGKPPTEGLPSGSDAGTRGGGEEREWVKDADDASSTTSQERQFLRPEEDNEAFSATDGEPDPENDAMILQKQIEDRYFVNTPTTPTTTTESRTDCEISTSQVDSSALEDLPLKRENRKKSSVALETAKIQQKIKLQTGKIKSQAGKLKTKLKTIKKPQFHMPERPTFERPKFNMPDRPKFHMPERPKFNMPERPKINLPDRPKINFPDKSKFRLPDRPKINLPERPKFNFQPKFTMPDKSKFKFPDRPKLHFSTFNRKKSNNPPNVDDKSTTESTSGSKKHILDFDFRTYPRIFSKKRKEKQGTAERPGTPPPGFATVPRMTRDRQQVVASKWEHASSKTDDEPRQYGRPLDYSYDKEPDFATKLAQVDKDYREMQQGNEKAFSPATPRAIIENQELWNKMERNAVQTLEHGGSLPHILSGNETHERYDDSMEKEDDRSSPASAGQHRRGVLEEIDNDEFFLRQKGISQDNIEVGKYLSDEIRDAFRSPVNALSQMDTGHRYERDEDMDDPNIVVDSQDNIFYKYRDDEENDEQIEYDGDINHNETMAENDDGYYTFPPVRPSRAKKLKALADEKAKVSPEETQIENTIQMQNVNLEDIPSPETFADTVRSFDIDNHKDNIRKHVFTSSLKEPDMLENLNEYENEMEQTRELPMIPKRRKKGPKEITSIETIAYEGLESGDFLEPVNEPKSDSNEIIVHRIEHIIPSSTDFEDPPALPHRRRSRSRGSRTTSIGDDDRTSRGAESIILDSHNQLATVDLDYLDDLDDGPGYAIVDKLLQKKVEQPTRPPAPIRRHRSAKSLSEERQFFTVPRALKETSPPRRPLRNYSTLGPSRPPRKKSTTSLTTLEGDFKKQTSSTDITQYVEIGDDEDQDNQKDLKSGDVVSKMKDRPLPPPPRPPRGPKRKKDPSEKKDEIGSQNLESENLFLCDEIIHRDDNNLRIESETNFPNTRVNDDAQNFAMYDQEEVVEIEVSTQTDPLPDDFDYELGMDEPLNENISECLPETLTELLNKDDKEEPEENSIDVEIFTKGLQKFRESSRPSSRASKSRTPIERPKTPLGRISPTAILVERRVSSPTRINDRNEILTEASLTVQPIDEPFETQAESFIPVHRYYPSVASQPFYTQPPSEPIQTTEPIPTQSEPFRILSESIPMPSDDIETTEVIQASENSYPPLDFEHLCRDTESPPPNDQTIDEVIHSSYVDNLSSPHYESTDDKEIRTLQRSEEPSQLPQTVCLSDEDNHLANTPRSDILSNNAEVVRTRGDDDVEILRTRRLQVSDLDVERLNVSELQASKILVSEIEGLSLQVSDINSKSGHIYVRGIELAPGVIEEIMQKFSQMAASPTTTQEDAASQPRPETSQRTQADTPQAKETINVNTSVEFLKQETTPTTAQEPTSHENNTSSDPPPERPPLPHIHQSMYPLAYYPEYSIPPGSFYRLRNPAERAHEEGSDGEHPSAPSRRRKHKREPVSSSEEEYRPVSRRAPPSRPSSGEPSVSELSVQLFRACQNSVNRTIRHILSYITSRIGGGDDKKDVQMAMVIFLVMVAGLIMLGVGDGRTVHHHHWDFFNPPNGK